MNFTTDVFLSLRRLRKDLGFTGIAVAILAEFVPARRNGALAPKLTEKQAA